MYWWHRVVQTMQVSKLLKYLSSLATSTSDEEQTAKPELLNTVTGITSYFNLLSGPTVSSQRYCHKYYNITYIFD